MMREIPSSRDPFLGAYSGPQNRSRIQTEPGNLMKLRRTNKRGSSRWPRQLELAEVRTIKLLEMTGVCALGPTGLQSLKRIPIGGDVAQRVEGGTYLRTTYKPDVDWAT